jgi:hypothetical protein
MALFLLIKAPIKTQKAASLETAFIISIYQDPNYSKSLKVVFVAFYYTHTLLVKK